MHLNSNLNPLEAYRQHVEPVIPEHVRPIVEAWIDKLTAQQAMLEEMRVDLKASLEDQEASIRDELQPYIDAWETFLSVWEEHYADGHWPGASPGDERLVGIMADDFAAGRKGKGK